MATNDNYYAVYVDQCMQLAATIAIKSSDVALAMNAYIVDYGLGVVDESDPSSWRYYKNLAGEYHPLDRMMQVTSMDTLEVIDFTVANLKIHRATANAYQYGTRQYQELVTAYPDQELLIRGILYPVDKAKAIAAEDGKILGGYPPSLIEVNEYSLIEKLQGWITNFWMRWYNRSYTVTDNLYLTATLGMMYSYLVPAIMTFRKEACKTHEAHSYHVRAYLGSHGFLDDFTDQLTTAQALEIYRNICYVERNPGKQSTFNYLIDQLLTKRNLPLASFSMRHDVSRMDGNHTASQPADPQKTDVYPTPFFKRTELNLGFSYDTLDSITVNQMLTKEQPTARDNAQIQPDVEPEITRVMRNSLSNVLSTKALESAMVDYTDSTAYTMEATLLNHWLWLSSKGYYTAVVNVENPRTGERIALPANEAWCFYWYAYMASIGILLDEIPPMFAMHVVRLPTPLQDDLLSVVDRARVGPALAQELLSYSPLIQNLISIESFYNKSREIWYAKNQQAKVVARMEHHMVRGFVDNMFNRIYSDNIVYVATPGERYNDWFNARNIDVNGWTKDELGLIATNFLRAATGIDLANVQSVQALQKAMIGMMQRLSSYSVQYISYINSGAVIPLDWPMVRQGDYTAQFDDEVQIPNLMVRLKDYKAQFKQIIEFPEHTCSFDYELHASIPGSLKMELPNLIRDGSIATQYRHRMELKTRVSYTPAVPANDEGIVPVLGIDEYLKLPIEKRNAIKDVYGSCWTSAYPLPELELSSVITNTTLSGLVYKQPD